MRILVIDTSGNAARWVGVENGDALDPVEVEPGRRHDSILAEGVRDWMAKHGWDKPDAVGVVTGPGGYSGLRVGVAFATAAAEGWGVKVVPVTAYEAVAARTPEETAVWALLPSRKNRCRCRLMSGGSEPVPLDDPGEISVQAPDWPATPRPFVLLGDGYERYRAHLDQAAGEVATILPQDSVELLEKGEALALVVQKAWDRGQAVSPDEVDVEYGAVFQPTASP